MSYIYSQAFDLHVCFNDPNGHECIGFDVYHRWSLPECRKGTLGGEDSILRCESRYFRDDFESVGFPLKFSRASNFVTFGRKRRRYRFPFVGTGSGGNMYWEVIGFKLATATHVLNWLRRSHLFQKTEWLDSFGTIWDGVRRLTEGQLREFGRAEVRSTLNYQAKELGCSVAELIALSKPQ